jgi:uncharacterized delta-60 repeat protein
MRIPGRDGAAAPWVGLAALVALCASVVRASDGDLDASFGTGGIVAASFGGVAGGGALALDGNGNVVVAGQLTIDPLIAPTAAILARYSAGGVLDGSFNGGTGYALSGDSLFGGSGVELGLQSDGKIVEFVLTGSGTRYTSGYATRYGSNGVLDAGFGSGGQQPLLLVPGDLIVLPDDRMLVSGGATSAFFTTTLYIDRRLPGGPLDAGFGVGGRVNLGDTVGSVPRMARRSDGGIVAAVRLPVQVTPQIVFALKVVALTANGAVDMSFGTAGWVDLGIDAYVAGMAVLSDDRIVLASSAGGVSRVHRLLADGGPDPTFSGGTVLAPITAQSIDAMSDGRTVLCGGGNPQLTVARLQYDGAPDPSFGSGGVVTTSFGDASSYAIDCLRQPDGNILAIGTTGDYTNSRLVMVRYLAAPAAAQCGDGVLTLGEQCDDGNTVNGDCCAADCTFESAATICRVSSGACDAAENCTGTSSTCPADVADSDSDGDGVCDAVDLCVGGASIDDVRLRARNYATLAGDDALRLHGRIAFAASVPLDPAATGLHLALRDASGVSFDITVPGGSGWTTRSRGGRTTWSFRSATPVGGAVTKLRLRRDAGGSLAVVVSGTRGSFAFDPVQMPATLSIGFPDASACGELRVDGSAANCTLSSSGATLTCRS